MADMAARSGATDRTGRHACAPEAGRARDPHVQVAPYALLAVALAAAFGLVNAVPSLFPAWAMPWFVALAVLAAAVRAWGAAPAGPARARLAFWLGLSVTLALVLLNPAFGLYAFIFYPDGTRLLHGVQARLGLGAVAVVCSLAQTGGPNSPIFTPLFVGLFLLVNLVVAGSMALFDRQRQRVSDELTQANARLRAEQSRNEALQEQLLEQARDAGVTQERARLAREIHDTIAQDLMAIIAQLAAASQAAHARPNGQPAAESSGQPLAGIDDELARRLDLAERTAREALAEARRSVRALSSPRLDSDDLPAAVQRLLDAWAQTTGATARLAVRGPAVPVEPDGVALRVIQEALANAARHAGARAVEVILTYETDALEIEIADTGAGFDLAATATGHGIPGMRQRVEQAGGALRLVSVPGQGTSVSARLPRSECPTGTNRQHGSRR